jgi:lipid II:glycine glycyltransferase (peptidoglycan interpeptide bridge formation enzyme)
MFRAISQGVTVGAHIWYIQGEIAYSHLAASSPVGYRLMASYALYWTAIEYLKGKVSWIDLGGGAGSTTTHTDGLTNFKRGWANGTRTAYFCGRIFAPDKYAEIVQAKKVGSTTYFPAYRQGKFG